MSTPMDARGAMRTRAHAGTFGYQMRIFRTEHLWLPAGLWALFVLMAVLMRSSRAYTDVVGAYLGAVLPLAAGILAAPIVIEDAALELQMAAPRRPWRLLVERLAVIFAIAATAACTYQLAIVAIRPASAHFGGLLACQMLWAVPTIAMMALASVLALLGANATAGAAFAGLVWVLQLAAHSWFAGSWWARYVYLFLGMSRPGSPDLAMNRIVLVALGVALVATSGALLRREERYL